MTNIKRTKTRAIMRLSLNHNRLEALKNIYQRDDEYDKRMTTKKISAR